MRWRRGFFRLWLLVAVLWVGIGAFMNFAGRPYFPELYVGIIAQGEQVNGVTPWSDDGKALENIANTTPLLRRVHLDKLYPRATYYEAVSLDVDVPTQASRLKKVTSYLESERARVESDYWTSCIKGFLLLGVLPPLLLLALGAAIGWALAGFRRATQ